MPNHITNRITIIADSDRIRGILGVVQNDEHGLGSLDFEKIIAPPVGIYRGDVGRAEQELYGKNTLLDFASANWGTKWNSYGYENFPKYEGGSEILFMTAWNRPEPVIAKLSKFFPDVQFQHRWADEDIGNNVGEVLYQNGEELERDIPKPFSKEAYEMAADIQGMELAEFGLHYNAELGNYRYVPDEELFAEHQRQMVEENETVDWQDIYISPDFQCDQTEGFPASLYWDMRRGTAWLGLNVSMIDENTDVEHFEDLCKKFGEQSCSDWDEFNSILQELGEDAVQNAYVSNEDESEEFGGMTLS